MPSGADAPRRFDTDKRDEAIARVRRTTRWVLASAALGTGVLVGVVAHELPAHSSPSVSTGSSGTASTSGTSAGGTTGTSGTSGGSTSTGSTTGSTSTGATTGTASTAGSSTTTGSSSVSQGSQQPAHAVTGQS